MSDESTIDVRRRFVFEILLDAPAGCDGPITLTIQNGEEYELSLESAEALAATLTRCVARHREITNAPSEVAA